MTPRWRLLLGGGMHCCAALLFVALFLLLPQTHLRTGTTSFQQPDAGQAADDLPAAIQPPSPLPSRTPTLPLSPGFKVVDVQRVESGPYFDMRGSPDGAKALLRKNQSWHYLYRNPQDVDSAVPSGTTTGLAELWLLDLKSGEQRLLAKDVGQYAWSPDSSKVAYIAPTETEGIAGMLYLFDLMSGETQKLTPVDFLGSDYAPQWLPSGEITFVRDAEVLKIRPDKTDAVTSTGLHFNNRVAAKVGKEMYAANSGAPVGIHFSPDGKRMAYKTYNPRQSTIAYQLWLADADGSNAQLVTEQAEGSYYEWSPDSQWLVFDTYRDINDPMLDTHLPPVQGLWAVRADGTDAHLLYKVDRWRSILSPNWSTDSLFVLSAVLPVPDDPEASISKAVRLFTVDKGSEFAFEGLPDWIPGLTTFEMWWSSDNQQLFVTQGNDVTEPLTTYRLVLVAQ